MEMAGISKFQSYLFYLQMEKY